MYVVIVNRGAIKTERDSVRTELEKDWEKLIRGFRGGERATNKQAEPVSREPFEPKRKKRETRGFRKLGDVAARQSAVDGK